MILTSPLMLLGLLALPALAAVYWLRSRSRRAVVSSLAFWVDQRRPRQGGRILHRMQTPLTLFLELLAIAMLVAAAAGPAVLKRDVVRPLMVVLDDSYSMLARVPVGQVANLPDRDSARRRGEASVVEELERNSYVTRFILAGPQPRLLGEPVSDPARAGEILSQWTCQSPTADLPAAMALAAQVGGPTARVLVISDHAPPIKLDSGQTEWRAFGVKLPNMAFTAAARTRSGENQRVLLEVANLSSSRGRGTLTLEGGNLAAAKKLAVDLAAGAAKQFFLELPAKSPALRATLDDDALTIDNQALLLPAAAKPLRVQVDITETNLRRAVVRAVEATGEATEVSDRPEFIVSDKSSSTDGEAWRLEILGGKDAVAYTGPFVVDRNNLLTQGLSLQNAIWSASPKNQLTGTWIVAAGNVPLLSEVEDAIRRRRLQMNFAAELSNLQDMPDWPILFANLMQWRRGGLPGLNVPNVRLGQTVAVTLPRETKPVEVVAPDKSVRKLEVRGRRIAVLADCVGLHTVKTPDAEYQFSCNTVSRDESDLTDCASGRWGNWNQSPTYQDWQASLSWIFMLVALAAMAAHMAVVVKSSGGRGT
jgi:hypothetical protein